LKIILNPCYAAKINPVFPSTTFTLNCRFLREICMTLQKRKKKKFMQFQCLPPGGKFSWNLVNNAFSFSLENYLARKVYLYLGI
jgi:hypothetical protein